MRYLQILYILLVPVLLQAQTEEVVNLNYNPVVYQHYINTHNALIPSAMKSSAADTLTLPFVDDFSWQQIYPDQSLWMDKQAFVNNTYPINRLSFGVATLDGLNEKGLPYSEGRVNAVTYGGADTLTSRPIDLSSYTLTDSLYLFFTYEPMGLGDRPDELDSLILEFKTASSWRQVWGRPGVDSVMGPNDPQFTKVAVLVDDAFFLVNDFQFRFRNKATIIGNNDHWHLDYVYLNDTLPSFTDIDDVSVLKEPSSFLSRYTMMPWDHFVGFEAQETVSNLEFCFRNNYTTIQSSFFGYTTVEEYSNTPIFTRPASAGNFGFQPESDTCFSLPASDIISNLPTLNQDSVVIATTVTINPQPRDITTVNDTITNKVEFFNLFAYDDGSAEKAYGLAGSGGLKKFAYRFILNHPDTLRAVLFHFTRIDYDASSELFSFYVWERLDVNNNGVTEDTLYFEDFRRPIYIDSTNGWATFKLDSPIVIQDTFYVGWQQTTDKNLQIGLDVNNDASEHMFYFATSNWFYSQVPGAPMIRPLVGDSVPLTDSSVGVEDIANSLNATIKVYPNPANSLLNIVVSGSQVQFSGMELYDLSGRLIKTGPFIQQVDVSAMQPGMYILRLTTTDGQSVTSRFVKY